MGLNLASGSAIRRQMLDSAGVAHEAVSADLDESAIKSRLENSIEIALELAAAKALAVSQKEPVHWIIGSDSVVSG